MKTNTYYHTILTITLFVFLITINVLKLLFFPDYDDIIQLKSIPKIIKDILTILFKDITIEEEESINNSHEINLKVIESENKENFSLAKYLLHLLNLKKPSSTINPWLPKNLISDKVSVTSNISSNNVVNTYNPNNIWNPVSQTGNSSIMQRVYVCMQNQTPVVSNIQEQEAVCGASRDTEFDF
jgi:hypothetical protein